MSASELIVDRSSSKLLVHTRASGMLARLAHDLELAASAFSGRATLEGEGFSAELVVPVAALQVVGTLHGERVDTSALSTSDRSDIERKIRDEVFPGTKEVRVRAKGTSRERAEVTVEVSSGRISLPVSLRVTEEADRTRVSGRAELSMKRLGLREVKGPLGAFRVRDDVEVLFDVILRPEA
ncbi:hypothetical protein [Polyangium mundeleinium]|uniref:Lipid/polyisoprenoid-binding YceI-like domain-containing protein n=1 Tax=Polyangium mundeleinium TaxID=2995306 RepID=A0ABT5EZJ6_9BACT|nr:hypothetical protein [Polyangium mundeleinium]MDC0746215.1 hypothetical protein [Polyangium mundeleinium]